MELLTTKKFNGNRLDCYRDGGSDDFWATREQIGILLGYAYPKEAIGKIHERNKERLDKFSGVVKLTTPSGTQNTTVYSFKGLLEICRYSNQPKANAVMDFLWEVADEIRRTGSYGQKITSPSLTEAIDAANRILAKAKTPQKQIALELGKIYESYTGIRLPLDKEPEPHHTGVKLPDKKYLTPSELAYLLGINPKDVNRCLDKGRFQNPVGNARYVLTGKGECYAVPRKRGTFSWDSCILQELEDIWNAL